MADDGAVAGRPIMALGATELRDRLASGALDAQTLVEACIARIEAREAEVRAWAHFDADFARHQARAVDGLRRSGRPVGALHGLPVGLKDIIDTARVPTENGCTLDAGRVPDRDAWIVQRLKGAGAIILGKTVTTELAFLHPGPTRNPHDPVHTPGGSSSGSAAAVADGMVPLAVGTQTGGSVIRPASFCGVTGFKPTFGAIPRTGILKQSHSLDTVGVFAMDPSGAAMLADVLFGHDPADPATGPAPFPALERTASGTPPLPPVFAVVRPPGWARADADLKAAMEGVEETLGDQAFRVELPSVFDDAAAQRERINLAEMSRHYQRYETAGKGQLSDMTAEAIRAGAAMPARDYLTALDWPPVLLTALEKILARCDAILCPAAPGPAPDGLESTGDSIFNGLWTLCGMPAVTVPMLTASNGLPMGVQLVGRHGDDARLLRTARWLYDAADHWEGNRPA